MFLPSPVLAVNTELAPPHNRGASQERPIRSQPGAVSRPFQKVPDRLLDPVPIDYFRIRPDTDRPGQ